VGMVYLFLPKGRIAINSRMFFLGAAFVPNVALTTGPQITVR